ncbi:MAG: hypothetical protein AAF211_09825 [Myxococcota bacterium]
MRGLLVMMIAVATAGSADEIVIETPGDIVPRLPPPDAKRWDPAPLVAAIRASAYAFSPADVYALIDRRAPERVIRAVCEKAGEPFDPSWRSLDELAAAARRGQSAERIELGEGDFDRLFTTLQRLEAEVAKAARSVAEPPPRGGDESQRLYERRLRRHASARVRALGPAEGRIAATSFAITLPATRQTRDGCVRPLAIADVSRLPFSTFRAGMGTLDRENVVAVDSETIEQARFTVNGGFRFEVLGSCDADAEQVTLELRRTHDGQWSGTGELQ